MAGRKCFDSVDSVGELFKDEVRRSRGTGAREHTVEEGASGSAWLGGRRRESRAEGDESGRVGP